MVIETKRKRVSFLARRGDEPPRRVQFTIKPKFRDPSTMTEEELTDPDFRLKQLEKLNEGRLSITCSKCHHCR